MSDVTVVIPTRDRPGLLAGTVASVLAQREVSLDVIVADDGSIEPVEVADERVQVIRVDGAAGRSAARNRGAAESSAEWLAFCDDDDLWAPGKLRQQLAVAQQSGVGWVYTGEVLIGLDKEVLWGAPPPSPDAALALLPRVNPLIAGASSVMVKRRLFADIGGFDDVLSDAEDWDLWLKLAARGPPGWVPHPLVAYRMHFGVGRGHAQAIAGARDILRERHGLELDHPAGIRRAAWAFMQSGERRSAARYYARAVRAGDLRSLGRLALALLHPAVGTPGIYRWLPDPDPAWCDEAAAWLAML